MSPRSIGAALAAAVLLALPGTAGAASKAPLYVSLGDSLAVGWQPGADGTGAETADGYTTQLAKLAAAERPGLRHVALGCAGATTTSMMRAGRPCGAPKPYANRGARTSQLAHAEGVLKRNRGRLAFVTVTIGANDILGCVEGTEIDFPCVAKGVAAVKANATAIATRLRKAAGKRATIVGMTYYNPLVVSWLQGESGKVLAGASAGLAKEQFNGALRAAYRSAGIKVADVEQAFGSHLPLTQTVDVPALGGTVPVALARICELTWMCTPAPQGPDIHANAKGYATIAQTFAKVLKLG
jgi:lysophospholipase L1-like esterase